MKNITLWNIPVDCAEVVVGMLRERAANMLNQGEPIENVEKMLWNIQSIEDELKNAKSE